MKKFISRSSKIYYNSENEFIKAINSLHASAEYGIEVRPGTPDYTTTRKCSIVFYYTEI